MNMMSDIILRAKCVPALNHKFAFPNADVVCFAKQLSFYVKYL